MVGFEVTPLLVRLQRLVHKLNESKRAAVQGAHSVWALVSHKHDIVAADLALFLVFDS